MNTETINFSKVSNQELLYRIQHMVQNERKMIHYILLHLNEVESRRLYFSLGCTSLFEYLTKRLGYSESCAYERINAARLLKKIPEISDKVQNGDVNLSQLSKIESGLKGEKKLGHLQDKQDEIDMALNLVDEVQNKTLEETKQILAEKLNQPVKTHGKKTPQKDQSVRLEFTLTKEQFETFKKAQDLMSHSVPDRNLSDCVMYLSKMLIQKKTGKAAKSKARQEESMQNKQPIHSAESTKQMKHNETINSRDAAEAEDFTQAFLETGVDSSERMNTQNQDATKRKAIPLKTIRQLMERAHHKCEFKNCDSTHQLQVDHRVPWSISQDDSSENLRILCAAHNRQEARRWNLKVS